ncbi:MAG: class I SAM-dependent methyltransferase [Bacteroidetes bacterium]|nr:MAG: class I SAM-dependent methyltransferase [Bacteroidota bacterium]
MWKLFRRLTTNVFRPIVSWYLKQDRTFTYKHLTLVVKKGVFHPGFFFSTKFLIEVIGKRELNSKTALELGAGSGLISFYMAGKGAQVTATDINTIAIEGLHLNNSKLNTNITIIHSDLFAQIPSQLFDYIIINPPYYPKNPTSQEEQAWFCGADYEYFYKLFEQLGAYVQRNTVIYMSLSEDCNVKQIAEIAAKKDYSFNLLEKKRIMGELNFIYQIVSK